jgi:tetratricopeptide (TPR) repeat protein
MRPLRPCDREKDLILKLLVVSLLSLCPLLLEPRESKAFEAVDRDVLRGIRLLYEWETDAAEACFQEIVKRKPTNPAGYFYLSMVSWSRLAIGFWSKEVVEEFIERIDRAVAVARAEVEEGNPTAWSYFFLGGALGFKGRFYLMERRWFSSFLLAAEAVEALKTCQQMDPQNKDVLLGLGIFDYYTAKMSGFLKFLTYLLVHRGDKEEGLRKLRSAAEEAAYSTWEAKSVLLHIYLFMEEDFPKALPLARDLAESFPSGLRYRYFEGIACLRMGMDSQYRRALEAMRVASGRAGTPAKAALWTRQALYLEAAQELFEGQPIQARATLDTILSMPDPVSDPAMIAWPLLKKGMSYDLEGEREKALEHYNRVLEMENGAGAQFLAQKYLKDPAKPKDPFIGY